VPQNKVFLYLEFEGLAAHDEAWKRAAASKILNDTKTGAMFEEICSQLLQQALALDPNSDRKLTGSDVSEILKHAFNAGFVFSQSGEPAKPLTTLLVRDVMRPETKPILARFLSSTRLANPQAATLDKPGGRRVVNPKNGQPCWWVEKNGTLILTDEVGVDALIGVLDGKGNNMSAHPRRTKLATSESGFEPVGWGFIEMTALGALPPQAVQLGADGIKSIQMQWGFDGQALRSVVQIEAPSPRKGALTLVDQPSFAVSAVPPLPDTIESFMVVSLDPNASLMKLFTVLDQAGMRDAKQSFTQAEESFRSSTKLDLRKDVLAHLGPRITVYTVPEKKGAMAALNSLNPLAALGQVPRAVVLVDIKDEKAINKSITQIMTFANKQLAAMLPTPPDDAAASPGARPSSGVPGRGGSASAKSKSSRPVPTAEFKMIKPKPLTYQLVLAPQLALLFSNKVTLTLSEKHLIIATEPGLASDAVALDEKDAGGWTPSGDFASAVGGLPSTLVYLQVSDPRNTTPKAIAELPAVLQKTLAAMGPAGSPTSVAGAAIPGPGNFGSAEPGVGSRGGSSSRRGPVGAPAPGGGGQEGVGGRQPQGVTPPGAGNAGVPGSQTPGAVAGPGGAQASPGASLFAGFTLNVPADKIPTAESIKPLLFPSSVAISTDAQGVRIVSREAFPDVQMLTLVLNSLAASRGGGAPATSAPMAGPFAGQQLPGAGQSPGASPGIGAGGGAATSRPD
jgi:hypothetical protein